MTQEVLKLALEALEDRSSLMKWQEARDAVKEALAHPEQEPVAHWSDCAVHSEPAYPKGECDCGGFPPQRTWVGLTDEEMTHANHHMVEGAYQYSFKQGAKWAEAKLKQKNGFAEENT